MLELQRTIGNPVAMSGIGLHTGTTCTMTFKPAPENHGIRFIRCDLADKPEIPATADFVVDVSRGTTLGIGEVKVHTDRKSTRLNSSHLGISYAVFCLKKKKSI